MQRMNLFTAVHKGLRAAMFDAVSLVARTDFDDPDSIERAASAVRRTLSLLEEHANHEDRVILPEIAGLGPTVFADLHAEHVRIAGLQADIAQLVDRLLAAPAAERLALGQRLHERMGRLVAELLKHMDGEETTAARLLWAYRTDEELRSLQRRILESIEPARIRAWAEIMLPAVNPTERAAVIAGLEARLPAGTIVDFPLAAQELARSERSAGGSAAAS